ncbi:MAG: transcriptional regulator, partial [Pseudoxanthomonas sp.]
TDYGQLPPEERNILRQVFCNPRVRAAQPDWQGVARFVVAAFRADVARAGNLPQITALIDDLCRRSPEFDALWRDHDVRAHGEGSKVLRHALVGTLSLEYSAFSVDGRPDLGMVVYSPTGPEDAARIRTLLQHPPQRA